nr:immunoglobulin heavy chain junction region [Mus musculus]
CARLGQDYW